MNKKWIVLFIILCVSLLAVSSVSATNFVNRDFDGYFSMDVPDGSTFQKDINDTTEDGIRNIMAMYMNEKLVIIYIDSPFTSNESAEFFYQSFFEGMYPDATKCYETQEGNLTILEPTTINELNIPIVGTSQGNKILIVAGEDLDTCKQMAKSAQLG